MWLFLSILCILPFCGHCQLGVDISTSVNFLQWTCVSQSRYFYGVVRVLKSNGQVDTNAAESISAGLNARMSLYALATPCFGTSCPNATDQVQSAIQYLRTNGIHLQNLVLDIEGGSWSTNVTDNIAFIQQLVVGVMDGQMYPIFFTNSVNWQKITGGSTEFSRFKLWYFDYDNNPNYDDFSAFGGWTSPELKQYQQNQKVCGIDVNLCLCFQYIDFYIGLPLSLNDKVARIRPLSWGQTFKNWMDLTTFKYDLWSFLDPQPLQIKAWQNPAFLFENDFANLNNPEIRALDFGSTSGFGTARSLAKIFSLLAEGKLITNETLLSVLSKPTHISKQDLVIRLPTTTGWGFFYSQSPHVICITIKRREPANLRVVFISAKYITWTFGLWWSGVKMDLVHKMTYAYLTNAPRPRNKQYQQNQQVCGIDVNLYYAKFEP